MKEGEVAQKFADSAFFIPPLYLFEADYEPRSLAAWLLERCERLAGDAKEEFYVWLGRQLETPAPACFFGSSLAIYGPSDADMLLLGTSPGLLYFRKPTFVSVLDMGRVPGELAADWGFFFLGPLLFPTAPPEYVLNAVDCCRERAFSSKFFKGGYGEILTYAAFKTIGNEAFFLPAEWEAVRHLRRFELKYRWLDTANMLSVSYSPHEVNSQIRAKLSALEERELHALAMAATRKIGIKEERRTEVAGHFAAEIRKLR